MGLASLRGPCGFSRVPALQGQHIPEWQPLNKLKGSLARSAVHEAGSATLLIWFVVSMHACLWILSQLPCLCAA